MGVVGYLCFGVCDWFLYGVVGDDVVGGVGGVFLGVSFGFFFDVFECGD